MFYVRAGSSRAVQRTTALVKIDDERVALSRVNSDLMDEERLNGSVVDLDNLQHMVVNGDANLGKGAGVDDTETDPGTNLALDDRGTVLGARDTGLGLAAVLLAKAVDQDGIGHLWNVCATVTQTPGVHAGDLRCQRPHTLRGR